MILGLLGMALVLAAFALEEFGRKRHIVAYSVLNLVGASSLGAYAWSIRSWPFLVLNIVWAGIALARLLSRREQ